MWTTYKNLSGESGVESYQFDEKLYSWIWVEFTDGSRYLYTDESCGWVTVLVLIQYAERGIYLNRYINDNQPPYADVTR